MKYTKFAVAILLGFGKGQGYSDKEMSEKFGLTRQFWTAARSDRELEDIKWLSGKKLDELEGILKLLQLVLDKYQAN